MKDTTVQTVVVDEANERTYILVASRVLTDGESYKLIRQEIRRRGGKPVGRGETLTITAPVA